MAKRKYINLEHDAKKRKTCNRNKKGAKEKEIQMPLLLEDEQEEINSYLCSYRGQLSIVSFYENKRIVTIEGYISKIDVNERIIKVGRKVIPLGMLLKIKEKEQF